ncbi:isomerase [Aliidiomarina sedimenti]|uniref:Isomerase n=1 Tax=Aliidiomarina sedimenti TaxID=1933879 RepID=A0ABY0BZS1_9GAMM|nr:PhzF family phenazine biosynthesis protein [Aliidiomarina sedimenti]RUO30032.1 isomerase [Aliidiomarina sedimenti]
MRLYQVDAFSDEVFAGNPAAVALLDEWLDDGVLQQIAEENNLSETAFLVAASDAKTDYELRWFTPAAEVDLCGHATLASAHVLFEHCDVDASTLSFATRSGVLTVAQQEDGLLVMDFPLSELKEVTFPASLMRGIGAEPMQVLKDFDYIAVLNSEAEVRALKPNFSALCELDGRGVLVTAAGEDCDFVSRCFFPKLRVDEDPVTGSAHCELAAYWSERLGKSKLNAKQLSARGGSIECEVLAGQQAARVLLKGRAVTYLEGTIRLRDR